MRRMLPCSNETGLTDRSSLFQDIAVTYDLVCRLGGCVYSFVGCNL